MMRSTTADLCILWVLVSSFNIERDIKEVHGFPPERDRNQTYNLRIVLMGKLRRKKPTGYNKKKIR